MSQALKKLSEEEGRFLLRLLERGDFKVLSPKARTRDLLMTSGNTPGLGRTAIKRASGNVVKNKAQRAADRFVENAGGMHQLIEWLEMVEDDPGMPTAIQNLLALARRAPHKRLSRLLAETGASHGQVVKWALQGAALSGNAEVAMELRHGLPKAMQNLFRIAHSGIGPCDVCDGSGRTAANGEPCATCGGDGKNPEHAEVMGAIRLAAEAGKVISSGKGDINVGVGVQVDAGGGAAAQKFFEQQMEVMDRVRALPPGKVPENFITVDAEVVKEKGDD